MNSIHSCGAGKDGIALVSSDSDEDFEFWRFADLRERRIVTDRADLFRKQKRGFPKAIKLSRGMNSVALFQKAAVKAWVRAQMNLADEAAQ
jgi:hypothetical protein